MTTNIVVGTALPFMPVDFIITVMLGAATAALLTLYPAAARLEPTRVEKPKQAPAPPALQLSPVTLACLVLGAALIQSSHAYLYAFGSIEWRAQGVSDSALGFAWAELSQRKSCCST